jgi:colanic acid/amylovoran biosynthesis glycosyltransferase
MPSRKCPKVGYIVRRFPALSETFVLNEILEVEAQGVNVEIFSLLQPRDSRYHPGVAMLGGSIRYVPGLDDLASLLRYNRRAHQRFGRRYRQLLLHCITRFRPALIWRFLEAGFVAERAAASGITHFHAHFASRTATVARLAGHLTGSPYSFTAHAFDIYKKTIEQRVLIEKVQDAAFVVTVSDVANAYVAKLAPSAAEHVERVYNGIDLDRFAPADKQPDRPFTIVTVARLQEKKGLGDLVDACARLRDSGREFRCRIIGQGRLRPALKAQIAALGLERHVQLLGVLAQDRIVQQYAEADLFVLPCVVGEDGNQDGLPVSIVEALASGLPVVTTAVAGIPEAVEDGVNGRIVPQHAPEKLAGVILGLMEDREALARLAAAARPSVMAKFDKRQTAARLRELFTKARS